MCHTAVDIAPSQILGRGARIMHAVKVLGGMLAIALICLRAAAADWLSQQKLKAALMSSDGDLDQSAVDAGTGAVLPIVMP